MQELKPGSADMALRASHRQVHSQRMELHQANQKKLELRQSKSGSMQNWRIEPGLHSPGNGRIESLTWHHCPWWESILVWHHCHPCPVSFQVHQGGRHLYGYYRRSTQISRVGASTLYQATLNAGLRGNVSRHL